MSKQSGLGSALLVGQYDLSGDVGALQSIETMRSEEDINGIDKSAMERLLLLKDGSISFASFWNITAGQSVPVLQAAPRGDVIVSFFAGPQTVGDAAASMTAKQVNYPITRGQDGSLGATTDAKANGYGLEWSGGGTGDGMLTTGKQSFATGTVDGTSIDLGAVSTLFGAAAYLHVITMPSGTATFAVQDSADNGTFADVAGMVFAAATGPTSERVQGAVGATVRRYVRLQGRGTHGTSLVACNFIRYLTSSAV